MQEHPAIRFLWLLPLAIVLLIAVMVWPIFNKSGDFVSACLLVLCAGGASWAFYERKTERGIEYLAAASLGALGLLHSAFDFAKGLPKRPIWMRDYENIGLAVGGLVMGVVVILCLTYRPKYWGRIIAVVTGLPMILVLLASRIGPRLGWW
jgi:hypothetical protein